MVKFKVKICQVIIIEFPFHRGTKIGADKPSSLYSVKAQQAAADTVKRIKEIVHPISNQSLTVLNRTTADGKTRRASTGNSTACSSYPIPEAPQHVDQLGVYKKQNKLGNKIQGDKIRG